MEVDRFQPQNKQAIESWHWSAFLVIPVMSTFETLKAFFMGSGRRDRGLKNMRKSRETCGFRLLWSQVAEESSGAGGGSLALKLSLILMGLV